MELELVDRDTGELGWVAADRLGFGYRTSILKHPPPGARAQIAVEVEFTLDPSGRSAPLRYGELTTALDAEPGQRAEPARVRDAVLELRRRKGMVLDDADHDTWSVGSFFTNPVVSTQRFGELTAGPQAPARLSTKHALALTNRGAATSADIVALARQVRDGVAGFYGVELVPEPVILGAVI